MQWLKDFANQAATKVKGQWSKFNNANVKNAMMAACALVAAADGDVSKEERSKVAKLVGSCDYLDDFNAEELRDLFLSCCDKASDEFARHELLRLVGKIKGNAEQSDFAVKVALIIANADGNFDDKEKAVVKEICCVLGLDSASYV